MTNSDRHWGGTLVFLRKSLKLSQASKRRSWEGSEIGNVSTFFLSFFPFVHVELMRCVYC